ncbi:NACHT domain-containing protein [Streptomyces formicae]
MSNHVEGSSGLNAPGAVFHEAVHLHLGGGVHRPGAHTPETEQLLLRVLQREFNDGASVRLLDPTLIRERGSIADVFVDLLVRLPSKGPAEESGGGASRHFVKQYLSMEGPSFRTVLTGGPGQGKTTAVQMVTHVHRAALLRAFDPERLSPRTATELERVERGLHRLELTPPAPARFPLWIEADALALYLSGAAEPRRSLWHYLAHRYEHLLKTEVSTAEIRALARAVPTALVLDGYDEVSPRLRSAVLRHIRDFADDMQMDRADTSIVVTSRPQAYGDELRPHAFTAWSLTDLSPEEAELHAAVLAGEGAEGERLLGLFRDAARRGDLPDILNTPLHVALVVSILADSGELPTGRHRLFARYYDHVYAREEGRGGELGTFLERYRRLVDELHRRAAFHIIVAGEKQHDARGIHAEDFAGIARSVVRDTGVLAGDDETDVVQQLLRFARERLVLIVGVDSDIVGFQIKSLVEFLAAAHLAGTDDERLVRERFRAAASAEPWRNVARFMATAAFETEHLGERDLRDSVITTLAELDRAPFSGIASLELSGAELAVDLLADMPELEDHYRLHLLPAADVIADLGHRADRLAASAGGLFDGPRVDELLGLLEPTPPARASHHNLWRFLNKLAEQGNEHAVRAAREHLDGASPAALPRLLLDTAVPEVVGPAQLTVLLRRADPHAVTSSSFVRPVDELPAWAWAAWHVMHSGTTSYGLNGIELESVWPLSGPLSLKEAKWLEPLATPPDDCHPHWTAWREVAEAVSAPRAATFASLARKRADFNEFSAWRMLPWPLREGLVAARLTDPLDARAWYAAEERWKTTGVRLHDIDTYLRHGALGARVASSGFAFAAAHWVTPGGADQRVAALAGEVWDIWATCRDGDRTRLAAVAENLLVPLCDYGLRHDVDTARAEQLREVIASIPEENDLTISYESALLALSDCRDDTEFAGLARRLSRRGWSVPAGMTGHGSAREIIERARRLLDDDTFRSLCRTIAVLSDLPENWEALAAHWIAPTDTGHEEWPLVNLLRAEGAAPTDREIARALASTGRWELTELTENCPYWSDSLRARVLDQIKLQSGDRWLLHSTARRLSGVPDPAGTPLPLARLKLDT